MTVSLDWENLGFSYMKLPYRYIAYYRNGAWEKGELSEDSTLHISESSPSLHYGQQAFEGLKAYRTKDGSIQLFRPDENAKRLQRTADRLLMPQVPTDMFVEACKAVVRANEEYVPPYGTGGTLYLRPLLIGVGDIIGVKPAEEYIFTIFAMPVGNYFKGGLVPTNFLIQDEYDRAAPHGTGAAKVGGNYAASLVAGEIAHSKGYAAVLYLDPKEKKYLDECGPANFFGIRGNSYITPQSHSILPSITNKSLQQLAEDMGLTVERRPVPFEEIATFDEAAECGTAAVIAPISQIDDLDENKSFVIAKDGKPGPVCEKLYHKLRAIQYGDEPDTYGWISIIE